jgi:LDH2 family malate/lactate/ureidoglycolate dehydrogenase
LAETQETKVRVTAYLPSRLVRRIRRRRSDEGIAVSTTVQDALKLYFAEMDRRRKEGLRETIIPIVKVDTEPSPV